MIREQMKLVMPDTASSPPMVHDDSVKVAQVHHERIDQEI
jgi:hypothetical protein